MSQPCEQLDDYLARDLDPDHEVRFIGHLESCPSCRLAVESEQRLDDLIFEATERIDGAPIGLVDRVRRKRRIQVVRSSLSIAAALAVAMGMASWAWRSGPPVSAPPRIEIAAAPPSQHVMVDFEPGSGVTGVAMPSDSPNVTVVMMFMDAGSENPGVER